MAKILFVANVHQHFLDCHIPYIKWLSEQGHEVHAAAGGNEKIPFVSRQFNLSIRRTPFSLKNITAYFELKNLLNANNYNLVYCHTPMGGVLARIASRKFRKKGFLKVLYVAHGFYFYQSAPWFYWVFFFTSEWFLARWTDALITINQEDYENAIKFRFPCKKIYRINGIGMDSDRFKPVTHLQKNRLRNEYGFEYNEFILIYAAEFISRKNHRFIINAIPELLKQIPELKVIFAGTGKLFHKEKEYTNRQGLTEKICFMGFRSDIQLLMAMADVGISSSRMEGLPMNVAEEMFCGLPVIATNIRGHSDLITNKNNGMLYPDSDQNTFIECVTDLYHSKKLRKQLSKNAQESVQKFSIHSTLIQVSDIFSHYL